MIPTEVDDFFTSTESLRYPEQLRRLVLALPKDSSDLYDLTFHAAFASRIFVILKREGAMIQGFERMQQSLSDSVSLIKGHLERLDKEHDLALGIVPTGSAQSTLGGLVEDLAAFKAWMLEHSQR